MPCAMNASKIDRKFDIIKNKLWSEHMGCEIDMCAVVKTIENEWGMNIVELARI